MATVKPAMWHLDDALRLVRELQPVAKGFGYHICLGGGILNRSVSYHDLDLYYLPLIGERIDESGLIESMEIGWGKSTRAVSGGEPTAPYSAKLRFTLDDHPINQFHGTLEVFILATKGVC